MQQQVLDEQARAGSEDRRPSLSTVVKGGLVEGLVLLALAVLPALFFWRLFTPFPLDLATIPRGDFTDIHYPYRLFLARALASGDSPFWNPHVVAGHPSLGDIQFQVFYPLSLAVQWLFGSTMNIQVLEALVAIHFSLASSFTYLFARRLTPGRLGPVVAALTFTYGGYLTSFPVQQIIILQVSIWLPLILLLLDVALAERRGEYFVLAAMAAAVAILAGHPQTVGYVAVGTGLYGLFRLWDIGFSYRGLLGLAAVPVLALGLAAVQLYPSFQHLQLTIRTEVDFAYASTGFALRELLGLVLPSQLGGRPLYVGLLPLVLAAIALITGHQARARLFWGILAFVALVVSFGGNTFAQPALYATVPVLKFFRNHERAAFLFTFALAILAAYGATDLRRLERQRIEAVVKKALGAAGWGAIAAAALALALLSTSLLATESTRSLFGQLADRASFSVIVLGGILAMLSLVAREIGLRRLVPILLLGLIVFDLFSTNWQNNLQPGKPGDVYPDSEIVRLLQADRSELFRVASEGLLPGDGNAGCLYGLYDVVGNSPLELDSFHRFDQKVPEWQRWRLLNVKYVITKRNLDDGRLIHRLKEGDVNLYEIDAAHRLPRAYVVSTAVIASSPQDALEKTQNVDPLRQVILRTNPGISLAAVARDRAAKVEMVGYRNGEIRAKVTSPENGILVFSEVYYPGWEAEVDGQPAQLLEANYLLRGVPLTAGDHLVRLVYRPAWLTLGASVSGLTLIVCLASLLGLSLLRRHPLRRPR